MTSQNVSTDVLRTMHRIHRQLADLRERLQRGPKQVRAAENNVSVREGELAQNQEEVKNLRVTADRKQLRLKTHEDKIEDLKGKLNVAASNREYQALRDQIAAEKMVNSVLDDEILEAWEKIEQLQAHVAEVEANVQAARRKAEQARQQVQQQEPLIQADLKRLQAELQECEATLPGDVRVLYQRVVRHRGEDALAGVEDGCCSGCHQRVPLNIRADIMLAHPMFCKACGRMLYMPEGASLSE